MSEQNSLTSTLEEQAHDQLNTNSHTSTFWQGEITQKIYIKICNIISLIQTDLNIRKSII